MTSLFVTRHSGAANWAARRGIEAKMVEHLDPAMVQAGDIVMGTLPIQLAAEVCSRGAHYWHLELDLPAEARGRNLTAEEMDSFGARLTEFRVLREGER